MACKSPLPARRRLLPNPKLLTPVEALCEACWRGPVQARVDKVEVVEADPAALGPVAGFRQIPTS